MADLPLPLISEHRYVDPECGSDSLTRLSTRARLAADVPHQRAPAAFDLHVLTGSDETARQFANTDVLRGQFSPQEVAEVAASFRRGRHVTVINVTPRPRCQGVTYDRTPVAVSRDPVHTRPVTNGDAPIPFGSMLRAHLDEQRVAVRELARRLAGTDGDVEKERRALNRYLSGDHVPQGERAARIEEALGLPAGTFPIAEDQRPARALDLLAEIKGMTETLAARLGQPLAVVESALDVAEVVRRLEELEVQVRRLEKATSRGLRALAEEVRALERPPDAQEPPAKRKRAAQ